ncbi:MAG: hypothetical protein MdMp014T_1035 [Treponematales bacterium]
MGAGVLFWEILRGAEIIAGWWFIFYLLYRPPTLFRRVALIAAFPLLYAFWYRIPINQWFAPGTVLGSLINDDIVNEILWAAILVFFALLCGNLRNSLFSALWYIGIEQNVDILRYFINVLIHGGKYVSNYPLYNAEYLLILGWAVFYYWHRRKFIDAPPLVFQILTVLTPFGATVLLTRLSNTLQKTPAGNIQRMGLYTDGALLALFFLLLNLIMFYLYIRLFLSYEVKTFAMEVADTPPVWTRETGLSEAFASKYKLSAREREVVGALLEGKPDKAIAKQFFISQATVKTHLRRIYQKTGAPGRFALMTLIGTR